MAKKQLAGKAGKYGKIPIKKSSDPKDAKDAKSKGTSKKTRPGKKNVPKSGKKALVSKEVLEALKENRQEKKELREKKLQEKTAEKKKGMKRKATEKAEPKEPLKKKDLKKVRQAHDNVEYDNIVKIKKLWEKARVNDLDKVKKVEYVDELIVQMKGKIEPLMFKHDMARVVQLLLRLGKSQKTGFIVEELQPHIKELAKSKYGKFTVSAMLKHGSKEHKTLIYKALSGNLKKLTLHTEAVTVVDSFYNDYANSKQRTAMITEFYGKELALYQDLLSEHLSKVIEDYPDKKDKILEDLLKTVQVFIEKGLTGYIIVQHLMLQYFLHGPQETIQSLVTDKLIEQIVNFVHTKEGSKIAMRSLWFSKAKERKLLIKTFKGHVKDMCTNENSSLVICALLDCVDDTVLVKKAIMTEIIENLDTIVMSQQGRSVINYILAPRSKLTHPAIIQTLEAGDTNDASKKDPAVRRKELLTHFALPLVENFKENIESLLMENSQSLLITNAINHVNCDVTPIFDAILDLLISDASQMESLTMHIALRHILQSATHQKTFSDILLEKVEMSTVISWANSNRGAFTLLRVLEHKSAEKHQALVEGLKGANLDSFNKAAGLDKLKEFISGS